MNDPLLPIEIRRLITAPGGAGVFLEAEDKIITIFVDTQVANALQLALNRQHPPRPLPHNLLESVLEGLGVKLLQVVIHDCSEETYYARLHLQQQNELGKSYVEIDCRPSDGMVLAILQRAPILITRDVWTRADNMKDVLDQLDKGETGLGSA